MKKILMLILSAFLFVGCHHQSSTADKQFELYDQIKIQLKEKASFDTSYQFRIQLITQKTKNDYRYDIIIDEPKKTMYDIIALAYANEDDQTMCPNVGIFDDESMHLKKNFVDKQNGFYKGIQLSGKTLHLQPIKVYISYFTDEEKTQKIEKYIEVKDEIR